LEDLLDVIRDGIITERFRFRALIAVCLDNVVKLWIRQQEILGRIVVVVLGQGVYGFTLIIPVG
jgi:hypothetical protein